MRIRARGLHDRQVGRRQSLLLGTTLCLGISCSLVPSLAVGQVETRRSGSEAARIEFADGYGGESLQVPAPIVGSAPVGSTGQAVGTGQIPIAGQLPVAGKPVRPVQPRDLSPPAGLTMIESVRIDKMSLVEAMQVLSEQTGLNIVTSSDAGEKEVSLYLRDVSAIDALDALVKTNGLYYRIDEQSGIVRISTRDEYERDLSSFREEQTQVFTLLYPNPMAVAQVIQNVFGDRVQYTPSDSDFNDLIDLSQRFNRFDLVDGRALG